MAKIGVVTITYNSADVLDGFFKSIWAQSHSEFTLYVVDNNSSDNTHALLRQELDSRIVRIDNARNEGVARANNQGVQQALADGCDYVLLLNNDVEFEETLFSKLIEGMLQTEASIVTPKMMYYNPSDMIWFGGSFFNKKKGLIPLHRGIRERDLGQYDEVEQIEYAPTCCVLIKREVFEQVGFMDEKYFVYFDDTDFFYRVLKTKKHPVFYLPKMRFYHKVGSLTKSNACSQIKNPIRGDFFLKYNIRNHNYYLRKHGGFFGYLYIVFLCFKWNLKFVLGRGVRRDWKTFRLINNSYLEGLFM
jgi:GT2 family glycosyltransferase